MTTPRDPTSTATGNRFARRQVLSAAAAAALVVASSVAATAEASPGASEFSGNESGTLAGNSAGSFAYVQISRPAGTAMTLSLTYAPFNAVWAHAIGFNVYQNGSSLASGKGQSTSRGDSANRNIATTTFTPSSNGGAVLIQIFNYSPDTITFNFTSNLTSNAASSTGMIGNVQNRYVYVGTYTAPNTAPGGTRPSTATGIYVYKMIGSNGSLSLVQTVPTPNPSWVVVDPRQKNLYCTNELGMVNGRPAGAVSAFSIDPNNGTLRFLNQQPTLGTYPAYTSVHPSGRYLLGTNYGTGNFPIYPIRTDGSLGPMTDNYYDKGSGPNRDRQEGPHAHEIITDPMGRYVFGADLGTDRVDVWTLDLAAGKLVPNNPLNYIQVAGGSGPRHLAFHPSSKWLYVISEMASSITAFSYDPAAGLAIWRQTVSTLPPDFAGTSASSELTVHPSGKFLYGANRGHNSIAIFAIDQNTGKLTSVDWQSTQGMIPRNFAIDPSGVLLYAANQNSDNIIAFWIDPNTGQLTPTGATTVSPVPVSVAFGRPVS